MPKQVDHEERRRTIAEALLRVAADRGLESVSLRHVAAEAGVSSGMVQHYFRTKDEMMSFALDVVSENVERRLTATVSELGELPPPGALARALLIELLPIDERRRAEGQVALAFLAYRSVNPAVAPAQGERERDGVGQLRDVLGDLIRSEQVESGRQGAIDATDAATALLALVDGLGLQVLGGQYPPDTAIRVFDACSAALLDHRPA